MLTQRWLQAPWWALSLAQGALFTVILAAGTALTDHRSFISALPTSLIAGVVFGALMGPKTARMRNDMLAGLPAVSLEQRRVGMRAARRGPTPTDPTVRQVAVHIAEQRLALALRGQRQQLLIFGLGPVGYVAASVWWSRWWLIGAVVFLAFFLTSMHEPRRWLRRLTLLTHP